MLFSESVPTDRRVLDVKDISSLLRMIEFIWGCALVTFTMGQSQALKIRRCPLGKLNVI